MRNLVLLGILCCALGGLLTAQSATASPDTNKAANLPWDQSALSGCLQTKLGQYTLIEEDGTSHELVGPLGKLKHQVGHEIEVIGKPGIRTSDTTAPGGASGVVEHPVFEVKSIKQIADKCKSGS